MLPERSRWKLCQVEREALAPALTIFNDAVSAAIRRVTLLYVKDFEALALRPRRCCCFHCQLPSGSRLDAIDNCEPLARGQRSRIDSASGLVIFKFTVS